MYILKIEDLDKAALELASIMLNFEAGKRIYDINLEPLPSPHIPWPIVEIPPKSSTGKMVKFHYRPTVGHIYFMAIQNEKKSKFLNTFLALFTEKLHKILDKVGYRHFSRSRTVLTTPVSVHKVNLPFLPVTTYVKKRRVPKGGVKTETGLVARSISLILNETINLSRSPIFYSSEACFSWKILSVSSALTLKKINTISDMNTILASILLAPASCCNYSSGTEIFRPLSLKDFNIPEVPLDEPTINALKTVYLLMHPDLSIEFSHQFPNQHAGAYLEVGTPLLEEQEMLYAFPKSHQCLLCLTPLGRRAVLISNVRAPSMEAHTRNLKESPFLSARNFENFVHMCPPKSKSFLICEHCWSWIDSPQCITGHMSGRVQLVEMPRTQAELCKNLPEYLPLVSLLQKSYRKIPESPGAFIVDIEENKKIILAGESLGPHPQLMKLELIQMECPILSGLKIVEISES